MFTPWAGPPPTVIKVANLLRRLYFTDEVISSGLRAHPGSLGEHGYLPAHPRQRPPQGCAAAGWSLPRRRRAFPSHLRTTPERRNRGPHRTSPGPGGCAARSSARPSWVSAEDGVRPEVLDHEPDTFKIIYCRNCIDTKPRDDSTSPTRTHGPPRTLITDLCAEPGHILDAGKRQVRVRQKVHSYRYRRTTLYVVNTITEDSTEDSTEHGHGRR